MYDRNNIWRVPKLMYGWDTPVSANISALTRRAIQAGGWDDVLSQLPTLNMQDEAILVAPEPLDEKSCGIFAGRAALSYVSFSGAARGLSDGCSSWDKSEQVRHFKFILPAGLSHFWIVASLFFNTQFASLLPLDPAVDYAAINRAIIPPLLLAASKWIAELQYLHERADRQFPRSVEYPWTNSVDELLRFVGREDRIQSTSPDEKFRIALDWLKNENMLVDSV